MANLIAFYDEPTTWIDQERAVDIVESSSVEKDLGVLFLFYRIVAKLSCQLYLVVGLEKVAKLFYLDQTQIVMAH